MDQDRKINNKLLRKDVRMEYLGKTSKVLNGLRDILCIFWCIFGGFISGVLAVVTAGLLFIPTMLFLLFCGLMVLALFCLGIFLFIWLCTVIHF